MVDWTRAEGANGVPIDCRGCRYARRSPEFTAVELMVCSHPRAVSQPGQREIACSLARRPWGPCRPEAQLRQARAGSGLGR